MRTAAMPLAAGALVVGALVASCAPRFGALPDAAREDAGGPLLDAADGAPCDCTIDDACLAAGAVDPSDFCRECRPSHSADGWTDVCTASLHHTTFDDFATGDLGPSRGRLYVAASGAVRTLFSNDVDGDGWADVMFTHRAGTTSAIYLGGPSGFDAARVISLPSSDSLGATLADLDADGRVDVVLGNHLVAGQTATDSSVYWNAPSGLDGSRRGALPTLGAFTTAAGDLDADGYVDVVFANHRYFVPGTDTFEIPSSVYWGGPGGFDPAAVTPLPTRGAVGVAIADVDQDGHLDVVVANHVGGSPALADYTVDSSVFWGAPGRAFDPTPTVLSTDYAYVPAIADLDADGALDVIVTGTSGSSHVFYGRLDDAGRATRSFDPPDTSFPAALAASAADLDGDGDLDVLLTATDGTRVLRAEGGRTFTDEGAVLPATIGDRIAYFDDDDVLDVALADPSVPMDGIVPASAVCLGPIGASADCAIALPTLGAHLGTIGDLGHLYDRSATETFVSAPILVPRDTTPTRLEWSTEEPHDGEVRLMIRSARVEEELGDAEWVGPDGPGTAFGRNGARLTVPAEHNHVQYRVDFHSPRFVALPALDSVTVRFGPP